MWSRRTNALFCVLIFNCLSSIYWKDYSFSIVYARHLCHKLIHHICMGLFLGSLFCLVYLCVCCYASTILLWTCDASALIFFLKIVLAIWSFFWFYTNFRIIYSISMGNLITCYLVSKYLEILLLSKLLFESFYIYQDLFLT